MRILVDTGVFSASISRRRRARFEAQVGLMAGHKFFLAALGTLLSLPLAVPSDRRRVELIARRSSPPRPC